jgi:hypothetical protein
MTLVRQQITAKATTQRRYPTAEEAGWAAIQMRTLSLKDSTTTQQPKTLFSQHANVANGSNPR